MKKLFIGLTALLAVTVVSAGFFYETEGTQQGDAAWKLATNGRDLRIYEFTPKTNLDMQCVFVAGSEKGGLQCFPKEVYKGKF